MTVRSILSLAIAACLITGCAQQPQPASKPTPEPPVAEKTPELPLRPFAADTLYALLVAEFAGSRGQLDVALANYTQQARETRDPQVAERAHMIARYLGAADANLETSLLWAEAAPDNQDAQASAILALIEADRLLEALDATRRATTRDNGALLQSIAANARNATDSQRAVLIDSFQGLLEDEPTSVPLLVGTALLLQQQQEPEHALALAEKAIALKPEHVPSTILASGLLHQLNRQDDALQLVQQRLTLQPDDTRLRLQYARLLVFTDLEQSQQQFQRLVDNNPHDTDLLLALAMVAEERGDREVAESSYYALLALSAHQSTAHYYLGQHALDEDDTEAALRHFTQVAPGPELINATNAILTIYIEAGNLATADTHVQRLLRQLPGQQEQLILLYSHLLASYHHYAKAEQVLNEGLDTFEHNSGMLYSRSLMHERQGNIDSALADLRLLLRYDPNNATALNALGYILADHTDRYEEAYGYIERALEQQPDDPATIDSMGWVHFKLGNYNQALVYLQRAMDLYPDHEIAAHLGEVLWLTGKQEQALEVWRTGLELKPGSHHIQDTLQRLGIINELP